MLLAHGGTISLLCACRRDRRDVRRRHRERARHCGGAAAAFVARRATEWHEFAVPVPAARGRLHSFLAWRVYTAPFEFIGAHDRLPSVVGTREHVPPVRHAVELP